MSHSTTGTISAMSTPSFRAYVDESGEEGFVFHDNGKGSSRWLVLSAVITRMENDHLVVDLMRRVRGVLGRPPNQQLHFADLRHEQRIPWVREIGTAKLRTVSVLVHKPSIKEPERFQSQKHLLYRYATRMLLERVSWLCRDHRHPNQGDGRAELIFSNRAQMSYEELRDYVRRLKAESDPLHVTVDWSVIDADLMRPVQHSQLAGLQIADAVASGLFSAVNPNRFGDTEDKYAKLILPSAYRHKDTLLGYGLKFWPDDLDALKARNPHLAGFV